MNLKPDELEFLKRHAVSPDKVHDGQNQSQALRRTEAERLGKILVLGPPCQAASHRLRTRAGHCVQCDPKKLAYQNRHTAPGYVYIAGSKLGQVIKIGTASNIDQRHRQLCAERYGGVGDWVVLFHIKVKEGGKVEQATLSRLQRFIVQREYVKDGARQQASEIHRCTFTLALKAVADAIGDGEKTDVWRSPHWRDYDFS
jgi:T5orf172 domain